MPDQGFSALPRSAMLLPLVALAFVLTACNRQEMMERFTPQEVQATAKAYVELLRTRDFDAIERVADPSIQTPDLRRSLEQMAGLIPAGAPTSVKVVGARKLITANATTTQLTFEYDFAGKWLLINVSVQEKAGAKTIVGFGVFPQPTSLEVQNRFSFTGKTAKHYAFLGSAVMAVLVTLLALVACIRTRHPGKKWPWILFILLGVGKLQLNWTSGEIGFSLLAIQLFSAGASAQSYGPWVISVALPLGAIVFLISRKVRLGRDRIHEEPAVAG